MDIFWTDNLNNSLFLFKKYGHWKNIRYKNINIYFSGFCYKKKKNSYWNITELIEEILKKRNKLDLKNFCRELDGHYTIVIEYKKNLLIISDWINSKPLYYAFKENIFLLSNSPIFVKSKLINKNKNYQAMLEVLAGGYTIGDKTVYSQIIKFPPGTVGYLENGKLVKLKYTMYTPGRYSKKGLVNYKKIKKKFTNILDQTFSRLVELNHDRKMFIPLSAGLDSRLILSGILRHGHKNITCYSYGLKGNTDTEVAKHIASKLNIPFIEMVTNPKLVRSFSKTNTFESYQNFSESYSSVSFSQDLPALYYFLKTSKIPKETLFVNGNTGDFISGGHIPKSLKPSCGNLNIDIIRTLFLDKHYSLWNKYKSIPYRPKLEKEFDLTLYDLIDGAEKKINILNIFEIMEWYHRQVKFVISGQKVYDFLNRDWRLPLWEFPIKKFFEQLNDNYKINQFFYKKCLLENNWQGIWKDLPINQKNIYPIWIRPIRYYLKSLYFLIGKEKWYDLEKKYINYWISNTSSYSLVPYSDSIFKKDVFKNPISLRSIRYLERLGLSVKDKSFKNFIDN